MQTIDNIRYNLVLDSLSLLENWVSSENYKGWDPYDGINNNWFPKISFFEPYPQILLIQFNKYSPINLRRLERIRKELDTKGLALFIQAYSLMYRKTGNEIFKIKALNLFKFLMDHSLRDTWGNHCWSSHKYPFVGIDKNTLSPHFPDIIGTANALKAISLLYGLCQKKELREIILDSYLFFKSMYDYKDDLGYFLYTPYSRGKIVPNASAEALEALILSLDICYDSDIIKICEETALSLQELQMQDGSWVYAIYPTGKIYQQLDFHQGYLIDGLLKSRSLNLSSDSDIEYCISKATEFYKNMFTSDGRCYYRYPKFLPTDIHNQAQGIITFCKLYDAYGNSADLEFAQKIVMWTIKNMQDDNGYFYHQKGLLFTNKIPYMRWGQGWMLLALATFWKNVNG